ncbi:GNAT family N-acetyltransferase [Citreimonas salinaria]|uniref:Acetyltransferase (GNAT) family protein n=1 Tax=Citreimonas salinaria TaxID=321339 RepID=A0A1H3HUZ7_9RHOB|nr:GNAT family N-acetyltransferase [Citreimonas salinaria]SDY19232.1 Acetyltransferase (GNAT) family protein [Citreimonas salinaria]
MTPDTGRLFAAIHATWPAARTWSVAGFTLRDGDGGGKRVSCATWDGAATGTAEGGLADAIARVEAAMREAGQPALFMVPAGADTLDTALAARGYAVADLTALWLCPVERLTDLPVPYLTAFCVWEPLSIMREIWAAGGIGPARLRVMERAASPKTGLFGRALDKPAGAGFCAIHDGIAMVHALEIAPPFRRRGLGAWMMRQAAFWARDNGADWMAVLCTEANAGANALYDRLRMELAGGYHYRIAPEACDG